MTRISKPEAGLKMKAREYTSSELSDFNQKIQRFYKTKVTRKGESLKVLDYDSLAVAFGAFVKRKHIEKDNYAIANGADRPTRFDQFCNIMDQWGRFMAGTDSKREFAIKKQEAAYEQLAVSQPEIF